MISVAPAGVIFTIAFFFSRLKKGDNELVRCLKVAVSYVPATVWMLWSMTINIQPVALSPLEGVYFNGSQTNILIILGRAILYILFILICLIVYRQYDSLFLVTGLTYLFGAAEWLLFIFPNEKGALDMMWGYNMSMYVFFIGAVIAAGRLYKEKGNKKVFVAGNVLYALHALSGLLMFTVTWIRHYLDYLGL